MSILQQPDPSLPNNNDKGLNKDNDTSSFSSSSSSFTQVATTLANQKLNNNISSSSSSPNNDSKKLSVPLASKGVMSAAISGAASMLTLQVFSKVITFICNQLILRHVAPEVFGVASIQLELLVATLLFLAREPIRLAVLRVPVYNDSGKDINVITLQRLINVAWLPPLVGAPLAIMMVIYYLTSMAINLPGYYLVVKLYAFGGMLDLLSEPFFTTCFALMRFKSRAAVEGAALTVQCIVTLLLTWGGHNDGGFGIIAFGLARISFGATFLFGFLLASIVALKQSDISLSILLPRRITIEAKENKQTILFDREILTVAISFLKQSLVKHVLTEGDKIILSMFYTPYHQGVYAVIFNYGSTIVRIIFWPMEEAARLLFSRMPESERRTKGRALLELTIKFHLTLGLFAIVFGTQYSQSLLLILAGDEWGKTDNGWSSAPRALAAYCWFIPVLGINGIMEAYVTSVANSLELAQQSYWLGIGAIVFACSAFVAYPLGATGLVIANAIHLFVRIFWSSNFIRNSVGHRTTSEQLNRLKYNLGIGWFDSAIPARTVMYGMALAYLIAGWTRGAYFGRDDYTQQYAALQYLAVGTGIATMSLFLVIVKDLRFVLSLWDLVVNGQIIL